MNQKMHEQIYKSLRTMRECRLRNKTEKESSDIKILQKVFDRNSDGKLCGRCYNKFPATLEYFYKSKSNSSGLQSYCKTCCKR